MLNNLTSTILYYPTIAVPSGAWLKQALLYWDKISSIVPEGTEENLSTDILLLEHQGIFQPIRPSGMVGYEFGEQLFSIIDSHEFQSLLPSLEERKFRFRIHDDKGTMHIMGKLHRRGLIKEIEARQNWFYFEPTTARLYMSLLAQYLAINADEFTMPGTDYGLYRDLIYRAKLPLEGIAGISSRLHHVFPIPGDDVTIHDILDFRRRRQIELKKFQQVIDDYQNDLSQVSRQQDAEYIVRKYQRTIKREVENLQSLFQDAKLPCALGTVETIIKTEALPAIASLGVDLPIGIEIVALGAVGTVSVTKYLIDQRNERRTVLRNSVFSYLYHAEEDGIININD